MYIASLGDIMTDHEDATILPSLISLAHILQRKFVAECAETNAIGFLRRHEGDEMQCLFCSHPYGRRILAALAVSDCTPAEIG